MLQWTAYSELSPPPPPTSSPTSGLRSKELGSEKEEEAMALLSVADQLKEGKEEIRGTGGGGTFDDGRRGSKRMTC